MSEPETTDEDYADPGYDPNERRNPLERGKWISALIAVLGIWMIVQAVIFDLVMASFWNDVIVGLLLVALGGYNFYRRMNERVGSVGAAALAALLGLWIIAAPFVFAPDTATVDAADQPGVINNIIVGVVVLILGAYSAYEARDTRMATPAER